MRDKIGAKKLEDLIFYRGETHEKLASFLGVDRTTVTNYVRGKREISLENLVAIARHYNVSTDYILGLTDIEDASVEKREVCNYLGLSEKAVNCLLEMKKSPRAFHYFVDSEMEQGFEESAYKAVSDFLQDPVSYSIFAIISSMKILAKKAFTMIDNYWKEDDPSIQDTYRDQITELMTKVKITMYELSAVLDDLSAPGSDYSARVVLIKLRECLNDIDLRSLKRSYKASKDD